MVPLKQIHNGSDMDSDDDDDDNKSEDLNDTEEEFTANDSPHTNIDSNIGWSDSIASILKTNRKARKTLVLSKAKKNSSTTNDTQVFSASFQVATETGEVKTEEHIQKVIADKEPVPKKKKIDIPIFRTKPNILDRNRERMLSKIATKGVVQLFNAVRVQQKSITATINEAGPLEGRRERALKNIDKRIFLNNLMGKKSESIVEENSDSLNKAIKDSSLSILRNDYMMSAKLKDWDKELEKEVEME